MSSAIYQAATLSSCETYRYSLSRDWDESLPRVNFVMLNPSTADAFDDDPTIRRCIGFARSWGFGSLVVTNLFALRATDPKTLHSHPNPVGPNNDKYLRHEALKSHMVVFAWGTNGMFLYRDNAVKRMLVDSRPYAIRLTAGGHPSHPLYLPKNLVPVPFVDQAKPLLEVLDV